MMERHHLPRPLSGMPMRLVLLASMSVLNHKTLVVSEAFAPKSMISHAFHIDRLSSSKSSSSSSSSSLPFTSSYSASMETMSHRQPSSTAIQHMGSTSRSFSRWNWQKMRHVTLSIRGGAGGGGTRLSQGSSSDGSIKNQKQKKQRRQLLREMIAELIGTYLIVQIGTGSVMSAVYTDSLVGLFQIASVWIIGVTVAICSTAGISGAHLNPAISLAFAVWRPSTKFGWSKVLPYSLAQLVGAILASWTNLCLYSSTIRTFEQTNGIVRGGLGVAAEGAIGSAKAFGEYFSAPVSVGTAFLAEAIGTGILAFVIFALTNPKNEAMKGNSGWIPPLIGLTVGALISIIAPLTQAGFNPARDFGPRIVAFLAGWTKEVAFQYWWVYVLAPIVGAPLGAAVADKILFGGEDD